MHDRKKKKRAGKRVKEFHACHACKEYENLKKKNPFGY